MSDDEDEKDGNEVVEDISLTDKETDKIEKRKAEKARLNPSNTIPIECPDCGCDYYIPLMKGFFTKSFAGNRMQATWPSREGINDLALVACPNCKIVYKINTDGTFQKTGNYWTKK